MMFLIFLMFHENVGFCGLFWWQRSPAPNWAPSTSSPQVMQSLTTSSQMKPSNSGKCNLHHDKCVIDWYQLNLFALSFVLLIFLSSCHPVFPSFLLFSPFFISCLPLPLPLPGLLDCLLVSILYLPACAGMLVHLAGRNACWHDSYVSLLAYLVEAREKSCSGGTEGLRCRHPTLDLGFGVFLLPESTGQLSDVFDTFWHLHVMDFPKMTCKQGNTEIGWGTPIKFMVKNTFWEW